MRRWRNLPFRRGVFWRLPPSPQQLPRQPQRRGAGRLSRVGRGQFFRVPPAPVAAAPHVTPVAPAPRKAPRLGRVPRGHLLVVPPPAAAAAAPPAWVAPQLRQPRRWLPQRRRTSAAVTAVTAVTAPAGMPRWAPRLARVPHGQFFPVAPAPPVTGTPGPLVSPHLRQRRAQPLRVPRGHRADPPWQGAAAAPVLPAVPQFPRQSAARARLPRRGCLFGVPAAPAGVPVLPRRRAQPGIAPPRRGCIFRVPSAPAGNTSPGPLVIPFLRAAGHRPRWPARPRRGCFFYLAPFIAPPPPFTVGTLTASGAPSSALTAAGASSTLTATTAAAGALTAATQTTGGPS